MWTQGLTQIFINFAQAIVWLLLFLASHSIMIVAIYVICSRKLCAGSIIYNITVLNVILML